MIKTENPSLHFSPKNDKKQMLFKYSTEHWDIHDAKVERMHFLVPYTWLLDIFELTSIDVIYNLIS